MAEIKKIIAEIEKYAPPELSYGCVEKGLYDNSGFLIDGGEFQTENVVFALDLCGGAVEKALECGAKLIVTHHPAIYKPIKTVGGTIANCLKNGISVYSAHLNLDITRGGIDDELARICGAKKAKAQVAEEIKGGFGFGRYFETEPQKVEEAAVKITAALNTDKYILFGDSAKTVSKIGSFCGAGLSEEIACDKSGQAELLISADIAHHVLLAALENGKSVLQLTHYASEAAPFFVFASAVCEKLKIEKRFYRDERFL